MKIFINNKVLVLCVGSMDVAFMSGQGFMNTGKACAYAENMGVLRKFLMLLFSLNMLEIRDIKSAVNFLRILFAA